MPNPSRSEEYDSTDMNFLINKIEFMRRNGVEYILFITRDKYDPVHGKLIYLFIFGFKVISLQFSINIIVQKFEIILNSWIFLVLRGTVVRYINYFLSLHAFIALVE